MKHVFRFELMHFACVLKFSGSGEAFRKVPFSVVYHSVEGRGSRVSCQGGGYNVEGRGYL